MFDFGIERVELFAQFETGKLRWRVYLRSFEHRGRIWGGLYTTGETF